MKPWCAIVEFFIYPLERSSIINSIIVWDLTYMKWNTPLRYAHAWPRNLVSGHLIIYDLSLYIYIYAIFIHTVWHAFIQSWLYQIWVISNIVMTLNMHMHICMYLCIYDIFVMWHKYHRKQNCKHYTQVMNWDIPKCFRLILVPYPTYPEFMHQNTYTRSFP